MDLQLRGKTAIVTGGSRGIGKAVARALAAEGVDVAVVARGEADLEAAANELAGETGRRVVPVPCDTSSDESVREMVGRVVADLGGVDILVNCAAQPGGQAPPPKLAEIDDDVFWPDVNVKVMGYLRCIREAVPHMVARGGGRIVNVSGLAARSSGSTVGSIRNVAVAALTKNLADELAPRGITVVVVHPALTRTEKTPGVIRAQAARLGVTEAEVEQRMGRANLLGRLVDAEEVAAVVAFLASPRATPINGDAVSVGGGVPGSIHY
ncbi:MAG TPA: SDR family oxidoreductase [Candidatus Dormibacteraeota bacterium]|nr:SDR family oxidoreductase [Candidatus Dormibacteraeota bacterium]